MTGNNPMSTTGLAKPRCSLFFILPLLNIKEFMGKHKILESICGLINVVHQLMTFVPLSKLNIHLSVWRFLCFSWFYVFSILAHS